MSNTKNIPYVIKTNGSVTLYLKSECMTVATDHPNYSKIVDALKSQNFDVIENLVNVGRALASYAGNRVRIDNGQVFYGTFAVHNTLTERILKMMAEGFKFDHMVKFLENLMQNPSSRSVDETYRFLENFGLPITEDGCFLAYKAVRNNYTDIYSGTFDNSVGKVVSMARNQVDDTYSKDCSHGLHVGALEYVVGYGHFTLGESISEGSNRLLIVKVNPKDVVSVPQYSGHTKMRVSEYTVVNEISDVVKELDKVVYTSNATDLAPDQDSDWDDDLAGLDVDSDDLASDFGMEAYDEGWEVGLDDRDETAPYGSTRDYDRSGDYLKGYNDAFNGRSYNHAGVEDSDCGDDDESACECDHGACKGLSSVEADILYAAEYDDGYALGTNDYYNGENYEQNLDIDASQAFKDGYHAGWVQADSDSNADDYHS